MTSIRRKIPVCLVLRKPAVLRELNMIKNCVDGVADYKAVRIEHARPCHTPQRRPERLWHVGEIVNRIMPAEKIDAEIGGEDGVLQEIGGADVCSRNSDVVHAR